MTTARRAPRGVALSIAGILLLSILLVAVGPASGAYPVLHDTFEDAPYLDDTVWDTHNGSDPGLIQDDRSGRWAVNLGRDPFFGRENLTTYPLDLSIFTTAEVEVVWYTNQFVDRPEVGVDFLRLDAWNGSAFVEFASHTPDRDEGSTLSTLHFSLPPIYLRDDARIRIRSTGDQEDAWLLDSVTVQGTGTPVHLDLAYTGNPWSGSPLTVTVRRTNATLHEASAPILVEWADGSDDTGLITDASGSASGIVEVPRVTSPTSINLQVRAPYYGFLVPLDVPVRVLPDASIVRGELHDDETNQPIGNGDVRLFPQGQAVAPEPTGEVAFTTSTSNGAFVLEDIPAGTYDLRVRAEGHTQVWRRNITVNPLINANPANDDTQNATRALGGIFLPLAPVDSESSVLSSLGFIIIYILAAILVFALVGYFLMRSYRRRVTIEDLFLIYHDGVLIQHQTRRLRPTIGEDVLASMLVAIQSFVQDSFKDRTRSLEQLHFGDYIIIIARGKYIVLAAVLEGEANDAVKPLLKGVVKDIESKHEAQLKDWDGTVSKLAHLDDYLDSLLMQ